ncbi:PfkB family carbohydrate kinase [Litoreibacter roseus]|uniref:Kinase n=1 Tax=Litoreibacter roseus TaxID=2601869 RepID=A0A6N6JKS6_9RHOB|nr:PfkB family carbohydrate kinase [Litoreibacter roseus]GFE66921.1 kinase [Litoreibacter roseus]
MTQRPDIICIGAVLWDIIGRATSHMNKGSDVPGRITRNPGGVALNIAMALKAYGMYPALLSVIGSDEEGTELQGACARLGMNMDHVYRSNDLPTDRYMAVEGGNGLIAAIADAHSLEAAGDKILRPLRGGDLSGWSGLIALDGNLTLSLLEDIAHDPAFAAADLRIAPASPGKAERLTPFLSHPRATLYVNLEEAGLLLHRSYKTSKDAALALLDSGLHRCLVTDGPNPATAASRNNVLTLVPREVLVTRVTGAGDTFMAAHIAAEAEGLAEEAALARALDATAIYISGESY